MAWLSTWNNRIKLTVSATDIDSDLTWFPIIIHLKTANGDSDKVFQEVGASSQKIAVTQSDGTTQLYVELENWDADAHTANFTLWIDWGRYLKFCRYYLLFVL